MPWNPYLRRPLAALEPVRAAVSVAVTSSTPRRAMPWRAASRKGIGEPKGSRSTHCQPPRSKATRASSCVKWTPSTSRGLTARWRCSGRGAFGRPLGCASKEATAQSSACASRSFPVSTTRSMCASGSSCRQRRRRTPVEQRASKTRMGAPSGTSQSCSSASAKSITERVLAGAIAGLRKPGPMRLAGPLGRASGLGCSAGRWTSVAPSSQRLPGQPSGSCMMER